VSGPPPGIVKTLPLTGLPGKAWDPSFSPDGSQVAFVWTGEAGDSVDIYVKLVEGGRPVRLTTNPDKEICPVWSPDGHYLAFARFSDKERAIFVIPAFGGSERKLVSANQTHWPGWGGRIDWSPSGEYMVYSDASAPGDPFAVFLLNVKTQQAQQLTSAPEHWPGDTQPVFSPDGQMLAFVRMSSSDVGDIYLVAVGGGEQTRLTFNNQLISGMAWTPDGHDIVFSSHRGGTPNLWRISAAGGDPQLLGVGGDSALTPALSRQGHRLAYSRQFQAMSTWRINLPNSSVKTGSPIKALSTTTQDEFPQISPDGNRIAFGSRRSGAREIWVCDSDGSNLLQLTTLGRAATGCPRWSPDGRYIAFDTRLEEQSDIYVINAHGGPPRRLTDDPADDSVPSWSRDGRSVYFVSNRSRDAQIWKIPADGGDVIRMTNHGGIVAFESADGKYLYYQKDDLHGLWRVAVGGGEEELVMDREVAWGLWAVVDKGIYYARADGKARGVIEFFDFATRRVTRVRAMERPPARGFAVSPDERWLLYEQVDLESMDIMLVENFR
jgi:Tol biopolymer transport system component